MEIDIYETAVEIVLRSALGSILLAPILLPSSLSHPEQILPNEHRQEAVMKVLVHFQNYQEHVRFARYPSPSATKLNLPELAKSRSES